MTTSPAAAEFPAMQEQVEDAAEAMYQFWLKGGSPGPTSVPEARLYARAALEAVEPLLARREREWRDIATAPKGEWVQVWRDGYKAPVTGMYTGAGYSGWTTIEGEDVFSDEAPSHWRRLPAPPTTTEDRP